MMKAMHVRHLKHLTTASLLLCIQSPALAAAPPNPKQDEKSALTYRDQANKGNANAALQLGNLLFHGRVPVTRFGQPAEWYRKGCDLGSLSACHNAGYSYESGTSGVTRDAVEAANYYLKAAERAFLPSMANLGALYANGHIQSADNIEGYKWLLIARLAANQCATLPICKAVIEDRHGHREKMQSRLSASEQRAAERLAMDWKPK